MERQMLQKDKDTVLSSTKRKSVKTIGQNYIENPRQSYNKPQYENIT